MRIVVVGLGSMGRRRLRNLAHLGGHELAGVEPGTERRTEVAAEHGIDAWGSFEEALEWGPDAVVISTPPDRHVEYGVAAAEQGLPFFMEASVVTEGVDELIELSRDRGVLAAPSCTMRFNPSVAFVRERVEAGAIGKVVLATHHVGQYLPDWHPWEDYRRYYVARRDTGAAREIVPFELNWMTSVLGPVARVSCMRGKVSSLDVDIDDSYLALVAFERGARATLVVEVVSRPALRRARLVGEEGTLEWDWAARSVAEWRAERGEWEHHPEPPPVQGPGGEWVAENMYIEEMGAFTAAAAGEGEWPLSLEEDHRLLVLTRAMEESSDRGATIDP